MIRPVEYQGVVQRNQDVAALHQNEHEKPFLAQNQALTQLKKDVDTKVHDVNKKDNADNESTKKDAKEKGQNEYFGDGGKQRKRFSNTEGTVKIKGRSRFDMKA